MRTNSTFSPDEDMQEIALRATLHEHAPTDVNVDHAWMIVSSQCQATSRQSAARSPLPMLLTWLPGKHSHPISVRARIVMGSLAFAVLLFVGINMLFPLLPGSGNIANADQYQKIGQSQSSGGLTITADKGYANDNVTVIIYTVQPSAELAKNLKFVILNPSYTVKDQNGQNERLQSSIVFCHNTDPAHYGWQLKCAVQLYTSHSATNTNTNLVISWDVTSVTLKYIDPSVYIKSPHPALWNKVINGNWHFHITLDIHPGKGIPPAIQGKTTLG